MSFKPISHDALTGARNSSLGHRNMAEASHDKDFPTVIPSVSDVFKGQYLQGSVIWYVQATELVVLTTAHGQTRR